jgi:hypothetical protein
MSNTLHKTCIQSTIMTFLFSVRPCPAENMTNDEGLEINKNDGLVASHFFICFFENALALLS